MELINKILIAFELHDVQGIQDCFAKGLSANTIHRSKPLIYELINMYTRGRLKECVQCFVNNGLNFDDKALLAVLQDDDTTLRQIIVNEGPMILHKRYDLDCTFTPLFQSSLLHICAEYNHTKCAKVILDAGIDVNTKAGVDANGFGAHSPIFHTVNQNENKCMDMLHILLEYHADLSITVQGLIWGKGYEWETYVPSVNPISYSMMGLLRQFQRKESQIYDVVQILMQKKYAIDYYPNNIPNKYLQ